MKLMFKIFCLSTIVSLCVCQSRQFGTQRPGPAVKAEQQALVQHAGGPTGRVRVLARYTPGTTVGSRKIPDSSGNGLGTAPAAQYPG